MSASLAVKLLVLHRLRTILVITGDCLDRLDSWSSGLRASREPPQRRTNSCAGACKKGKSLDLRHVYRFVKLTRWQRASNPVNESPPWSVTHPFNGLFLLFSWCPWHIIVHVNYDGINHDRQLNWKKSGGLLRRLIQTGGFCGRIGFARPDS